MCIANPVSFTGALSCHCLWLIHWFIPVVVGKPMRYLPHKMATRLFASKRGFWSAKGRSHRVTNQTNSGLYSKAGSLSTLVRHSLIKPMKQKVSKLWSLHENSRFSWCDVWAGKQRYSKSSFAVLHFLDRLTSGTLPRLICRSFQLQWITVTLKMLSWYIYNMHTQDDINGISQIPVGTVLLSRAAQSWCTPLVEIYCTNCFSSKITSRHHPTSCRNFVEEHDFWLADCRLSFSMWPHFHWLKITNVQWIHFPAAWIWILQDFSNFSRFTDSTDSYP